VRTYTVVTIITIIISSSIIIGPCCQARIYSVVTTISIIIISSINIGPCCQAASAKRAVAEQAPQPLLLVSREGDSAITSPLGGDDVSGPPPPGPAASDGAAARERTTA